MTKRIFLFILLAIPLRVFSMTLDQCVQLTLSNSELIRAYEQGLQSAFYAYKADKSSSFSDISLSAEADVTKGELYPFL